MDDFEYKETKAEIEKLREETKIVQEELHEIRKDLGVLHRLEDVVKDLSSERSQSYKIPDNLKRFSDRVKKMFKR